MTTKNIFLCVVIVIAVTVLWQFVSRIKEGDIREIEFSEFYQYLKQKPTKIQSVNLYSNEAEGTFTDGGKFKTVIPGDSRFNLSKELIDAGVSVKMQKPDQGSLFYNSFSLWLPVIFFVGFWIFFIGQMMGRSNISSVKHLVKTNNAPAAIGPYSQAVKAGELIFVSGQIPLDPTTGNIIEGGISEQTQQVLKNVEAILRAAGSDTSRIVKTTVYLANLSDFAAMNEAYSQVLKQEAPARATVQVARLPRDVLIEIDAIALVQKRG